MTICQIILTFVPIQLKTQHINTSANQQIDKSTNQHIGKLTNRQIDKSTNQQIMKWFLLLLSTALYANDGAFFGSGNHLVPIMETDISVQKEILYLKKIQNKYIEVSVYYEFFNPKEDKEITVGFEAESPDGDVDGAPKNGHHPYMFDFTVNLNNAFLPYQISYVTDSLYAKGGKIKSIDLNTFDGNKDGNDIDFRYVYHFKAKFKKGVNILKHTYKYNISGGIAYNYHFDYILTAANRWANKRIDDFTLIIDMGAFQTASIERTFFKSGREWLLSGVGKITETTLKGAGDGTDLNTTNFYVQQGLLLFQKKNFTPKGELRICDWALWVHQSAGFPIDYPFTIDLPNFNDISEGKTDEEKRLLRNLPFARRGYIFKDKTLQAFYNKQDWYQPNPSYIPEVEHLSQKEKELINSLK